MKRKPLLFFILTIVVCIATSFSVGCNPHVCSFTGQVTTDQYKASDATCTEKAQYYYSCECGEMSTDTFEYGEVLGHSYGETECLTCGESKLDLVLSSDGQYYIVQGVGLYAGNALVLPDTYKGKEVKEIDAQAFKGNETLTSVVLGANITKIKNQAFRGCTGLVSIELNNKLTTIGESSFYGCSSLASIDFPETLTTIGLSAFRGCSAIKEIKIPDSVTSLGSSIFYGCSIEKAIIPASACTYVASKNLKFVEITSGQNIPADAFKNNTSLTEVILHEGVKKIGSSAFSGCTALEKVSMPKTISSIDTTSFNGCVIKTATMPIFACKYVKNNELKEVVLNGGKAIESATFAGCVSLEKLVIPTSVTSIHSTAFTGIENLTIYCEAESKPTTWNENWNSNNDVIWRYAGDNHTYGEWVENSKATCTESGTYKRVCTDCSHYQIKDVKALGHTFGDWKENVAPTCTENGSEKRECENCSHYELQDANALGHTYGAWVIDVAPTCLEEGSKHQECVDCQDINSTVMDALGHDMQITAHPTTCAENGYDEYMCANCEYVEKHDWEDLDCTVSLSSMGSTYYNGVYCDIYSLRISITGCGSENFYNNAVVVVHDLYSYYYEDIIPATTFNYNGNWSASKTVYLPRGYTHRIYINLDTYEGFGFACYYNVSYRTYDITYDSLHENDDVVKENEVEVGCVKDGSYDNVTYCTVCGGETSREKIVVDAIGVHDFKESNTCVGCGEDIADIAIDSYNMSASTEDSVRGYVVPRQDGYYDVYIKGTGAMKDYSSSPFKVDGYNIKNAYISTGVTSIGNYAFYYCTSLTSIEIPDSVTSIGNYAFLNCNALTGVTIGDGLTSIGNYAFRYCYKLISIEIPDSVTSIGNYAFENCESLTSIEIPANVTSIGERTFYNCESLTSITIQDSVTSIGNYAFYNCKSLTSIEIPDSVTSIGNYAFYGCTSLTSITIGNSVTSMGEDAFYNTGYYNNTANWENKVLYIGKYLIEAKTTIDESEIKEGTLAIVNYAFQGCESLTSITIPDSITRIGNYAFYGCTSLTSIEIPANVTSIGERTFYNCTSLTSITIPDSVTSIGNYAFYNCKALTSITIPDNVTSIGSSAFSGCPIENASIPTIAISYISKSKLKTVVITSGASIGSSAFSNCTSLTSVTIGDSVTSIDSSAFSGCSSLESITLPFVGNRAGVTSTDTYQYPFGYIFGTSSYTGDVSSFQFYYGSSTSSTTYDYYYIPSTLKEVTITGGYIPYGAFSRCTSLTSITIGDSVTSIGNSAFSGCESLTSITIGDSVTSIGEGAFAYCASLTSIEIPDSVTSIGERAFSSCSSLESITLPFVGNRAGVTSTDTYQYPFGYIFGTSSYTGGVKTEQSYYDSSTSSTTSSYYYIPSTLREVTITGGYIPYGAFFYCTNLTSITIGDSVTSIGWYAFYDCESLTSIVIPDSVTSIGEGAFFYCTSLTSIEISDSVTSIGNYAFEYCDSLTSITIGDSVTSIGSSAFYSCDSLTSVTIGDSVTSIGNYAFAYCTSLTSIEIPDSVTSIGSQAFYDCDSLTSVNYLGTIDSWAQIEFGNSYANPLYYAKNLYINNELVTEAKLTKATSIGSYAFAYCESLTSVTIGESVTSIGNSAFSGCYKLVEVINKSSYITIEKGSSSNGYVGNYALVVYNSGDIFTETKLSNDNRYIIYADGNEKILVGYNGTETELVLPTYITKINKYAFYDCDSLTSITIGESVTSIGEYAFYDCDSLTSITIGESVTNIGNYAFAYCTSLTSIEIPDSVTSIGSQAFYDCDSLTSVNYLGTIDSWAQIEFGNSYANPLYYAKNLYINNELVTEAKLTKATSIGNYAFAYCTSLTSVTIGDSVTSIGSSAFSGCTSLTSVTIGDSVTSIGSQAFSGCPIENASIPTIAISYIPKSKLKTVVITSGESIGNGAFYDCDSLTSIVIPNSVTSIGNYAFEGCDSVTSVTIGDSVTSIGSQAFSGCYSLTSINFNGTKAQWDAITKGSLWKRNVPATCVTCSDGTVNI